MARLQRGFTIIELVIVIVILTALLFVVIATSAAQNSPNGNAQRRADVNALVTAVTNYASHHNGALPPSITSEAKMIASTSGVGFIDLCAAFVPTYMNTLPLDPSSGSSSPTHAKCTDKNVRYNSGYTIQITSGNHVKVAAPAADGQEDIFAISD